MIVLSTFSSEVLGNKDASGKIDMNHLWVGDRFSHSSEPTNSQLHKEFAFKKSIIPTRNMFQIGLRMSGACKIDKPYDEGGIKSGGFCYKPLNHNQTKLGKIYFDDVVPDNSIRKINANSEGVLYHIMYYRRYLSVSNETSFSVNNDYTKKYFKQTLNALRRRNLDLLVELPEVDLKCRNRAHSWTNYEHVYQSKNTSGFSFPQS